MRNPSYMPRLARLFPRADLGEMGDAEIHQPNDKLLRATFSVPENARGFFENHLPANLASVMDWGSLSLEPCTFIDPHLSGSESDLLFRIKLRQSDVFLYLLFEHQSSEDPRMALRLLSYILRIWERFSKNETPSAKLPPVLPVVLAQGKRVWKTTPRLEDLIGIPAEFAEILGPWQPRLAYKLLELVRIPYGEIAGTAEGILTLRALKAEPVNDLLADEIWDESLLLSISESAFEQWLRYVLNADVHVPELQKRIRKIRIQPLKNKTMTLAERLREEGKMEGKVEGQLQALRMAVLRTLEIRCGGCPEGIREAVELVCDHQNLERLLEVAIRANSHEEFAQKL